MHSSASAARPDQRLIRYINLVLWTIIIWYCQVFVSQRNLIIASVIWLPMNRNAWNKNHSFQLML